MTEEDRCDGCGEIIDNEDLITVWESRGEFWGAPCKEEVVVGYECSKCGHRGEF